MNNLTCESGKQVLDLLKIASENIGRVQSEMKSDIDFLLIAQPIDAVISYIERNHIEIP